MVIKQYLFFLFTISSITCSPLQSIDYEPSSEIQSDGKWNYVLELLSSDSERREKHEKDASPILNGSISPFKAFKKGHEKVIAAYLKLDNEDRPRRKIIDGEEVINEETVIMADAIKSLLQDADSVEFIKVGTDYFVVSKGESHNLKHLLQFANFNQISFTKAALSKYRSYIKQNIIKEKPELDFPLKDPEGLCINLELAEKEAINIYSGRGAGSMNSFLRGDLDYVISISNHNTINGCFREVLLHCAVAVSGLNKMPDYSPPPNADGFIPQYIYRGEYSIPDHVLQQRKWAVDQGGEVTLETGFFSTAYGKPSSVFFGETSQCGIMFKNLKGKKITPLADYGDEEREILIPPTHVQWRYHKDVLSDKSKKRIALFLAKPVTAPHGTVLQSISASEEKEARVIVDIL